MSNPKQKEAILKNNILFHPESQLVNFTPDSLKHMPRLIYAWLGCWAFDFKSRRSHFDQTHLEHWSRTIEWRAAMPPKPACRYREMQSFRYQSQIDGSHFAEKLSLFYKGSFT